MASKRDRNVEHGLLNGLADVKTFFLAVKDTGLLSAIKKLRHVAAWRLHTFMDRHYDRDFDVQTSSHAFSWDLDMRSEGDDIGIEEPMYLPTSSLAFRRIMFCLPDMLEDFVFVDYGSGKGRTLLLAAEYGFRKIVGVEFAKELHVIAEKNIASYRSKTRKCNDVSSILIDATIFDLPDGPCVLYFFNPFEEVVMRKVMHQIRTSYLKNPRKMILVYYKPKFPEIFAEQDFIRESRAGRRSFLLPNPYGLIIHETQTSIAEDTATPCPFEHHGRRRDERLSIFGPMARGAAWMMSVRWVVRGLDVLSMIILARLLVPDDFGVFAIGTLVVGLFEILSQAGIDLALIRDRKATDAHFNAAWTIQILQGLVVGLFLLAVAPLLGWFFAEPRAVLVIQLLALRPIIQSFTNIGVVRFLKDMEYQKEFWFGFYKKIGAVVATLILAYFLRSYMALVYGTMVGALIAVFVSYRIHSYRPRVALAKVSEIWFFSVWILVYYAAEDLVEKLDRIVVGRLSSSASFGQYQMASLIAGLPLEALVTPLWRALIPAYSKLSHEPQEMVDTYLKVLGLTALVSFAVGFGVASVAEDLVLVLLGDKWAPAVVFVQYLALVPAIAGVVDSAMMIVSVTGHSRLCAIHSCIRFAVLLCVLPGAGALLGIEAVAQAYLICAIVLLPMAFLFLVRVVNVSAGAISKQLWRPVVAGGLMYLAVKGFHSEALDLPVLSLALDLVIGAVVYLAANVLLWLLIGRPAGPELMAWSYIRRRSSDAT